jgi:hypothetical protein
MFKELSGKSGKYSNYCRNMRRTTCNKRRKSSGTDIKSFSWLLITLFLPFFAKPTIGRQQYKTKYCITLKHWLAFAV